MLPTSSLHDSSHNRPSKENRYTQHHNHQHTEEGYHSLPGSSSWVHNDTNSSPSFGIKKHQVNNTGYYSTTANAPDRTFRTSNDINNMKHSSTPIGGLFGGGSPIDTERQEFLPTLNSSFLNNYHSDGTDGRGILIERIKVAQHTIDSLSAKVFFYENERTLLREKKEHFEKGYYKLVEENSQLLNDKIHKDTLLKKLTLMEGEIGVLLKTQENLQGKQQEQVASIESYKCRIKDLEEENEAVKKVNDEFGITAGKNRTMLDKVKQSEDGLRNQNIVLGIEKETLTSELDRLVNKLKTHDEKLRCRKEKEQELLKENALLRQECRAKDREMRQMEDNFAYLEDQLRVAVDQKDDLVNQSKHNITVANEEMDELRKSLTRSEQHLTAEKDRIAKINGEKDALEMRLSSVESKLVESELALKTKQSVIDDLQKRIRDGDTKFNNLEKDNSTLRQRIRNLKQENTSLTNTQQLTEERTKADIATRDELVNELKSEIQKLESETLRMSERFESDLRTCQMDSGNEKRMLGETVDRLQSELESITHHFMEYKNEQTNCMAYSKKEIEELKKNNTDLSEQIRNSDEQVQKLTSELETIRKELQSSLQAHNELNLEFEEKIKCSDALSKEVGLLQEENKILQEKNTGNINLIDKLNVQSKSEIGAQKAMYDNKLKLVESDYESMKVALRDMEQEKAICVETYKKQIAALQSQSDNDVERLAHERDELSTSLQTANMDLDEYKANFNSLKTELGEVSSVNTDLKLNLSLLSKELETYQQDSQLCHEKDEEIRELQEIVNSLRKREEDMAIAISRTKIQKNESDKLSTSLQQEFDSLKSSLDLKESDWEARSKEMSDTIDNLTKSQRDLQTRCDKLKTECRKRAVQSHATCGELQMVKTDAENVKKELEVVVELNKKLELVNQSLQQDNQDLTANTQQLQNDIGILKSSYEELLAKELSKQKSEFIMKENQLLKRLSTSATAQDQHRFDINNLNTSPLVHHQETLITSS